METARLEPAGASKSIGENSFHGNSSKIVGGNLDLSWKSAEIKSGHGAVSLETKQLDFGKLSAGVGHANIIHKDDAALQVRDRLRAVPGKHQRADD